MVAVRIEDFKGKRPKADPRLLPLNEAVVSINVRLTDGKLTPYRFESEQTINNSLTPADPNKPYRMYDNDGDYWLSGPIDADYARSPVLGDEDFTLFITSTSHEPRATNIPQGIDKLGGVYPTKTWLLGVPPPGSAPTVVSSGGTGQDEDRVYVYTWVNRFGEESAPSAASTILTGKDDDNWTVTTETGIDGADGAFTAASWAAGVATITLADVNTNKLRVGEFITVDGVLSPWDITTPVEIQSISGNDITFNLASDPGPTTTGTVTRRTPFEYDTSLSKKRVYRSVTTATNAGFFFVGEIDATTADFVDTAAVTVGEELSTQDWLLPPVDMQGIINHPSGSVVGFSGNTVYVSEPLAPYAFPPQFNFAVNFPIVGLGVIGTTIVVVTEGNPYLLQGTTPEFFSLNRLDFPWHGLSKTGVVSSTWGVVWPSSVGLVGYSATGAQIWSKDHYTQKEWEGVFSDRFEAQVADNKYFARYTDDESVSRIFVYDFLGQQFSDVDVAFGAIYVDAQNNQLYGTRTGSLFLFDEDNELNLPQQWRSRVYDLPQQVSLSVAQVEAGFNRTPAEQAAYEALVAAQEAINAAAIATLDLNGSLNDTSLNTYGLNASVLRDPALVGDGAIRQITFNLYVDGNLYYSKAVGSNVPFRLPSGFLYDEFQMGVIGTLPITSIAVATSVGELRRG